MLNVPLICLSLKYIHKNYELISNVSKWIYFELTKLDYKESKFIKSLGRKDFEVIKILITSNKNIDLLSKYLAEYCSFDENYFNIVELFIENGADIRANNDQALINASSNNHFDIVKLLIDNGADIHANNNKALRWASHNGHLDIVKLLIDNGADIHARNGEALIWASRGGHLEIVKLLVENGADIHSDNDEILKWASRNGHIQIVNFLKSLN